MPRATMVFFVPEDAAALADVISEHGPEEGVGGLTDAEEIAGFLSGRAGQMAEVSFESDDPSEPVGELADALEEAGVGYWGVHDAFVERSRGIRVRGRAVLNLFGAKADRRDLRLAWEDGPPSLDARTLRSAGMAQAEADAVVERFSTPGYDAAAPGPR